MDTQQKEALSLLVVTVVGVEHLADLLHHVAWIHGAGGLHAPRETQRPWLHPFRVSLIHRPEQTNPNNYFFKKKAPKQHIGVKMCMHATFSLLRKTSQATWWMLCSLTICITVQGMLSFRTEEGAWLCQNKGEQFVSPGERGANQITRVPPITANHQKCVCVGGGEGGIMISSQREPSLTLPRPHKTTYRHWRKVCIWQSYWGYTDHIPSTVVCKGSLTHPIGEMWSQKRMVHIWRYHIKIHTFLLPVAGLF